MSMWKKKPVDRPSKAQLSASDKWGCPIWGPDVAGVPQDAEYVSDYWRARQEHAEFLVYTEGLSFVQAALRLGGISASYLKAKTWRASPSGKAATKRYEDWLNKVVNFEED